MAGFFVVFYDWLGMWAFIYFAKFLYLVGNYRDRAASGIFNEYDVFSNLLNWKRKHYPDTDEDTTVVICARNEEKTITRTIWAILNQQYLGHIHLLVVDNASNDNTREKIYDMLNCALPCRSIEYVYCEQEGKVHALNTALCMIDTPHFITVDADTYLEQNAVQKIMNHIVAEDAACVAGNLFAANTKASLITKMQNYDYLLSIASVKRFQGSYASTLVAQGAFSAYQTEAVCQAGGWQMSLGEDIVLTYNLPALGKKSGYEPEAVGYTTVPQNLYGFYNQRKRWAIGMIEGLKSVPPWKQGRVYPRYFAFINLCIIYLDAAFLFGFVPGVILAFFGYFYFVGLLTLLTLFIGTLLFLSMYLYQKQLHIPFQNSFLGFVCFLLFFQTLQSTAAMHGYCIRALRRKGEWK